MRVEVVESLPAQAPGTAQVATDTSAGRALASFLAAIDSDESLFACEAPGAPHVATNLSIADFVLKFRAQNLRANRRLHFSLVEKLVQLLKAAGSEDSLAALLSLVTDEGGMALCIRLEARGNSLEQAELRWGLGVAHLQQALLFSSRYLRQQLAQTGD